MQRGVTDRRRTRRSGRSRLLTDDSPSRLNCADDKGAHADDVARVRSDDNVAGAGVDGDMAVVDDLTACEYFG